MMYNFRKTTQEILETETNVLEKGYGKQWIELGWLVTEYAKHRDCKRGHTFKGKHYTCLDIIQFKILGLLENDSSAEKKSVNSASSVSSPKKPLWKELDDKKVFDIPKKNKKVK